MVVCAKLSTLEVLEARRFDKIKPVRDSLTEALQLWKMVAGKGEDGPTVDPQVNDADTSGLADVSKLPMNTISDSILGQSAAKPLLSAEAFENEFLEFPPVELLHEQELVDADTLYMMPPSGCQSHLQLPGLACVPIVALHFSHAMMAKRCLVLVLATGLLFILIQPPIALSWTYHSEVIKAARLSTDDISIYGFMASKPTWPSWLLIATILLTIAALTSIIPINTKVLPWVFALLVALFPVTYLLEGQVRIKSLLVESGVGDVGEDESKLITLVF
ncbi:hypothetical protein POM88_042289 [Heracleum sosnowskyi]|uniref:Uncharacterized protein n=1 Tax=Heracleum sosnowskyi TaxID=360622 RepID=A0AAD8HHH3_9APIA|nr:hypothetical protein POM88_042289 [Heracleum sosnowskyi]